MQGGISPQVQHQFEELVRQRVEDSNGTGETKKIKFVVIVQDCVEPLQALKNAGQEGCTYLKEIALTHRNVEDFKREREQEKKHIREQRRKKKKEGARITYIS